MGFFGNKNKNDICPKEEELKSLVTNFSGGRGIIKVNAKLTVPKGYLCIFGRGGKVADKFEEGEYFLNFSTLPYMCRKFGIDKIQDGKQRRDFSAECYFIDKSVHAGKFKTYRKVEMGTKAYGIFKAEVFGIYSYKVINAQELMQSLLNEYDYIKTGEAENIIESWVNDMVVDILEKNNFIIDDVVKNSPIIADKLKASIGKLFNVAGLELLTLRIYKYKLPKQYQAESDEAIRLQEEKLQQEIASKNNNEPNEVDNKSTILEDNRESNLLENKDDNNEDINASKEDSAPLANNIKNLYNEAVQNHCDENKTVDNEAELSVNNSENNSNIKDDFIDSIKIKNKDNEIANSKNEATLNASNEKINVEKKEIEDNQVEKNYDYVPFGNFVIGEANQVKTQNIATVTTSSQKPKEKTFVDLNVDKLYSNEVLQTKRCLNCGGQNDVKATHCTLCGQPFWNE